MTFDPPRVLGERDVPPDQSIVRAVGRHHSLETALADLVDNSLDAGAKNVLIRLLSRQGAIVGLRVVDDGKGMDGVALDAAMEFARKREYGSRDLGHFGIGLKAASLSQADTLRVYSRRYGAQPAGRQITSARPTVVAELDGDQVGRILNDLQVDFALESGTVVEWSDPRTFLSTADPKDRARWLDERITAIVSGLGIVFHRILARGQAALSVDVLDVDQGESGIPRKLSPIDPFGYQRLAGDAFPQPITIEIDGGASQGEVHVWPAAQSGMPSYRLGGRPGSLAQGFYFYRHDRLLQVGGWNTVAVSRDELEYARIAIEIDDLLAPHIAINPEKAGLELDSDLKSAILAARVGTAGRFKDFLGQAEDVRRESRRYTKRPVRIAEPSRGFSREMLDAFTESAEFHPGGAVDIRWRVMASESPVQIDVDRRTIWLNQQYREFIVGTDTADNDDAPVFKTLILLLCSELFEGAYLGSREKQKLETWDQLLTAALRTEITRQARRIEESDDD